MERNVLKERLMNKDDNNRHFVLLIIDISKHGAKEMVFVRNIFWNKTGSSCCNIIHETGSCHFDMTHFFRPVLTYINN
jgi:hypothetical protein